MGHSVDKLGAVNGMCFSRRKRPEVQTYAHVDVDQLMKFLSKSSTRESALHTRLDASLPPGSLSSRVYHSETLLKSMHNSTNNAQAAHEAQDSLEEWQHMLAHVVAGTGQVLNNRRLIEVLRREVHARPPPPPHARTIYNHAQVRTAIKNSKSAWMWRD